MTLLRGHAPLMPLVIISILVALVSYRFVILGFDRSFDGAPFDRFLLDMRLAFIVHVCASPIALALGGVQFLPKLRRASPRRHRFIGLVYAATVAAGASSAVALTFGMADRPYAAIGFFTLGVAWMGSTTIAIGQIALGSIQQHREWMIRSFALTASAITLRLYLSAFLVAGTDYYEASSFLAWACWVPNLIAAELLIRFRRSNEPVTKIHSNHTLETKHLCTNQLSIDAGRRKRKWDAARYPLLSLFSFGIGVFIYLSLKG